MNDLISRQEAIDKIDMLFVDGVRESDFIQYNHGIADSLATLHNLPSAQPEIIIRCKDCKAIDAIKSEIEQMDFDFGDFYDHTDSIVEKVLQVIDKYKADGDQKKIIEYLEQMPSAQPASQETTAEWVPSTKYNGFLTCSACEDCYIEGWSDRERKWRFCPSCGARLVYEGPKK